MPAEAKEKAEKVEKEKVDPKVAIPKLLEQLKNTTEQTDKRKIRARLRALGHKGGLPLDMRPERVKKEKKADAPTGKNKPAPAPAPAKRASRAAGA